MKFDLATAIITAIVGVTVTYLVANSLMGEPGEISVKTPNSTVDATLAEPSPEIFNYRALNPTVETYVGNGEGDEDKSGDEDKGGDEDEDDEDNDDTDTEEE